MQNCLRYAAYLALFLCTPSPACAQVVLIGCTGNTSNFGPLTNIVDIDPATGAVTNPRNTGVFAIGGIATQPSTGIVFGLTTFASSPASTLIRIDVATGGYVVVGATGLPNIVEGDLAFNPLNGFLYGIQDFGPSFNQRNLFRIDPAIGVATVLGSLNTVGDYSALAFNSLGTLYSIDTSGTNSSLNIVDPSTGSVISTVMMSSNLGGAAGLAFDPFTGTAFVADGGAAGTNILYTLNVSTGSLSPIGSLGIPGGISGLTIVNVPEPSSLVLVTLAGLAMIARRRRDRPIPFVT